MIVEGTLSGASSQLDYTVYIRLQATVFNASCPLVSLLPAASRQVSLT